MKNLLTKGKTIFTGFVFTLLVGTGTSIAAPVGITGYDILNADVSGTGGWFHTYDGTITPLGGSLANYSGGTGTMADGVSVGTTNVNTHVFVSNVPWILTLHLDNFYTINQIDLYGGDHGVTTGNFIPGGMNAMDITINSVLHNFGTTPFGPLNAHPVNTGNLINDSVLFSGSPLENLVTNQIVISNVTTSGLPYSPHWISIAEIVIDGGLASPPGPGPAGPAPVPEPSTMLLLGSGLVGLIGYRMKKARP